MSTGPSTPPPPAASTTADRRLAALHQLLERRQDLRGAYAPADLWSDAVRWSV